MCATCMFSGVREFGCFVSFIGVFTFACIFVCTNKQKSFSVGVNVQWCMWVRGHVEMGY